jgi:hypothetical protein
MVKLRKVFFGVSGLGIISVGLFVISTFPQSILLTCWKPDSKQNNICSYGIYEIPTISRVRCSSESAINAVCEETRTSVLSSFLKYSRTIVDPTGSYIHTTRMRSNGSKEVRSRLIIVNYQTKESLFIPNLSGKSYGEINLIKENLGIFLKDTNKKLFQVSEPIVNPWIGAVPLIIIFVGTSFAFFRESYKS